MRKEKEKDTRGGIRRTEKEERRRDRDIGKDNRKN